MTYEKNLGCVLYKSSLIFFLLTFFLKIDLCARRTQFFLTINFFWTSLIYERRGIFDRDKKKKYFTRAILSPQSCSRAYVLTLPLPKRLTSATCYTTRRNGWCA